MSTLLSLRPSMDSSLPISTMNPMKTPAIRYLTILSMFILCFVFFWIILYSFNPSFVHDVTENTPVPSPSRCLGWSMVAAMILIGIAMMVC